MNKKLMAILSVVIISFAFLTSCSSGRSCDQIEADYDSAASELNSFMASITSIYSEEEILGGGISASDNAEFEEIKNRVIQFREENPSCGLE